MGEIKTYTGIMFDPIVPESEKIDIVDIAHALSMLCRGNGHMKHFYSVGQHSVNCMMEALRHLRKSARLLQPLRILPSKPIFLH